MARLAGALPRDRGLLGGLYLRFVYWLTRRKMGEVVTPVKVLGHHLRLLGTYGTMEMGLERCRLLDEALKELVQMRAARLIDCPF